MKPKILNLLKVMLLLLAAQAMFMSCSSDDEPDYQVNYYLALDSSEIIGLSEDDETQGTLLPPQEHSAYITFLRMKRALTSAYPTPVPTGNDARVIAVCDSCFRESIFSDNHEGVMICTVRLMRANMSGDRVVSQRQLKYYKFNRYSLYY